MAHDPHLASAVVGLAELGEERVRTGSADERQRGEGDADDRDRLPLESLAERLGAGGARAVPLVARC